MKGKPFGIALLICATFIWGGAFVAQSVGMRHMGALTFNAVRFLIGGVFVFAFVLFFAPVREKNSLSASGRDSRRLVQGGIACGVILFVSATFQQVGIYYTTVGKAGFITALYILFVPILSISLGRKVSSSVFVCVAIAMVGMYLLCINERLTLGKGDIYVFVSAVTAAAHILLIGYFSPLTDSVKLACIQFFVCGVFSAIGAYIFEPIDLAAIVNGWAPLLYAGVLSCGVAYTFQAVGQKIIDPVVASLIFSLEAVFAVFSGWLVLGERLSAREISGCILIFIALVMAQSPRLFTRMRAAMRPCRRKEY